MNLAAFNYSNVTALEMWKLTFSMYNYIIEHVSNK